MNMDGDAVEQLLYLAAVGGAICVGSLLIIVPLFYFWDRLKKR